MARRLNLEDKGYSLGRMRREVFVAFYFSGAVGSEISAICQLIQKIIHEVDRSCAIANEDLMTLRLVLSELMINSCEHGNRNNRTKQVYLTLEVGEDRVHLIVSDEGEGFQMAQAQEDKGYLSCSGRGLRIVSRLCETMEVRGTTVECCFPLVAKEG